MSFYKQNTIVLSQNNNLLNHAANSEIFPKISKPVKYMELLVSSKYYMKG